MPVRTTALMQAFMPGESPPEVNTPIFLTLECINVTLPDGNSVFGKLNRLEQKNSHFAVKIQNSPLM
jgi:hypothetical protein